MAWYDLDDTKPQENENNIDYNARIQYNKIVTDSVANFSGIAQYDLKKGSQYRIITKKSFNAFSIIEYLASNFIIKEICIAIYDMNIQSVRKIRELVADNQIKINIIISSYFKESKNHERWADELLSLDNINNTRIVYADNQAKVFLAETTCGKYIVFEGSGNLDNNNSIEQYLIENNKQSYDFHKKWITDIIGKNNVNHK